MTTETTTAGQQLLARAEHDTDWHLYIDPPGEPPVGYCGEHGGDELVSLSDDEDDFQVYTEPFNPVIANGVLRRAGWRVTGSWREPTEEEDATAAYVAPVARISEMTPDQVRDQDVVDLRAALERAAPMLEFAAGREAVGGDAEWSERLLAAGADIREVLTRTNPEQP